MPSLSYKEGDYQLAERAIRVNHFEYPDQPVLDSSGMPNPTSVRAGGVFQNTVTGQDQLRQRVAVALNQIWVLSFSGFPSPMPIRLTGGFSR